MVGAGARPRLVDAGLLWILALLVSFGVASHACYPATMPVTQWLWSGTPVALKDLQPRLLRHKPRRARRGRDRLARGAAARSAPRFPAPAIRARVERVLSYASTLAALALWFALLVNGIEIWLISHCGPA